MTCTVSSIEHSPLRAFIVFCLGGFVCVIVILSDSVTVCMSKLRYCVSSICHDAREGAEQTTRERRRSMRFCSEQRGCRAHHGRHVSTRAMAGWRPPTTLVPPRDADTLLYGVERCASPRTQESYLPKPSKLRASVPMARF